MDELVVNHFGEARKGLRYFFAGGGSYTQPRAVKAFDPQAQITVAELDPVVTETVREYMTVVTTDMRVLHGDARVTLNRLPEEYFDVIVTDAFHDIAIPYHLVTKEYMSLVRSRLSSGGLYTTNIVDAWPDPKMVKSIYKTLRSEFSHVYVWLDNIPQSPQRMTFVISASDREIHDRQLYSQRGFRRTWHRIDDIVANMGTDIGDLPILTDNYVPVERLISSLLMTEEGL
jgi:spermidine synthase